MSNKREYYLDTVFPFGKHTGEMVEDLLDDDPSYLMWCYAKNIVEFDLEVIREMEKRKII